MINKIVNRLLIEIKYRIRNITKPDDIELYGVKLNINHPSISNELRKFFYNESYEGSEIRVLKKVLTKNDKVLEIGAGIGFISTYCSKQIGSENVVAYEANPKMVEKIKETYQENDIKPTINNIILSNENSEMSFYLEKNFWSSSMVKRNEDAKEIKVKTKNINNEISKYKSTFLIIDIEGGEEHLIPIIDFNAINKVLIELHPSIIGNKSISK